MRAVILLAAAVPCLSLKDAPIAGDNFALWPCASPGDALEPRQALNISASHIFLSGAPGNLVVDLSGPSGDTDTPAHAWGLYTPVHPSQTWSGPNAGGSPAALASLGYPGMCLQAEYSGAGAPLTLQVCSATEPLQSFDFSGGSAPASRIALHGTTSAPLCVMAGGPTPSCTQAPWSGFLYCNASADIAARVADVVGRMTLAEKAGALDTAVPAIPRLALPRMNSGEALHGVATSCLTSPAANSTGCPTSFPCALALAASYDASLWTSVGAAIGIEARAMYNLNVGAAWLFTPNVNLFRDPRWGRGRECAFTRCNQRGIVRNALAPHARPLNSHGAASCARPPPHTPARAKIPPPHPPSIP